MALVNNQNLYSGAAQVFNNAPHLAFQARLLAHQAAKQEALDAYYRRLPLTINEKGVRDQERPLISDSLLGIKDYYIKNKDRIRQGDQAAAYNYERMVREHQNLVEESQKEGLTGLQVGKLLVNPNTAYVSQSKDFMDRIHSHSLPINDPNHVSLDLEELTLPPKPYDRTTYFKNFAQLKGNDNIQRIPNRDGTQTVVNTPTYEEPQKEFVMSVAGDKYLHDPSFTKMVDEDLGEANASNVLNDDFKANYGHDIQTPIDLATAYTFNGLKPPPRTEKIQADQLDMMGRRQKFAIEQQARGAAFTRGNLRYAAGLRKDAKTDGTVESADAVLHNIYDIVNEGEKVNEMAVKASKGTPLEGAFNNLQITISDPNLLKNFAAIRKVGTTPVPPDQVTIDKTKDQINLIYNPVTYASGATQEGATISMSGRDYVKQKVRETYPNKDIGEINNIVDKIITQKGGLYKTIQMYNPENQKQVTPTQKTSPVYTREDYKNAGWTDKQIEIATKAGKIKIK